MPSETSLAPKIYQVPWCNGHLHHGALLYKVPFFRFAGTPELTGSAWKPSASGLQDLVTVMDSGYEKRPFRSSWLQGSQRSGKSSIPGDLRLTDARREETQGRVLRKRVFAGQHMHFGTVHQHVNALHARTFYTLGSYKV